MRLRKLPFMVFSAEFFLKGMLKEKSLSCSVKYCRIDWSRSRALPARLGLSVTNLKAFRMQYFTISSLVFRSRRNLRASTTNTSRSRASSPQRLAASCCTRSSGSFECSIR